MEPWSPKKIAVFDTLWDWLRERAMWTDSDIKALGFDDDAIIVDLEVEALSDLILKKLKEVG